MSGRCRKVHKQLAAFVEKTGKSIKQAATRFVRLKTDFEKKLTATQRSALNALKGVLCIILAFLLVIYGPFPFTYLSDLYITTAMRTSDHKYLATMLYSDKYISKVLARNSVKDMEGLSDYTPSEYIGSDKMELTKLEGYGCSGYLITVYDESRISLVKAQTKNGELLENIAERIDASAAINASGYVSNKNQSAANGLVIYNGISTGEENECQRSFVANDYSNRLYIGTLSTKEILSAGFKDVVEFGPVLILNGEPCDISGNGGGLAPRTAIGITADRRVLLLVLEGRQGLDFGASLRTVQEIMLKHGAVNACNLDGGFSSSMYYEGELISAAGGFNERMLPNAIVVTE